MDETFIEIDNNLFLGNYKASMNLPLLTKHNISHILCVGIEMTPIYNIKFKYMKIQIQDSEDENILFNFNSVYKFITEGLDNGIFLHCLGGISRSSTIVIAFLMRYKRISLIKTYNYVKSLKPDIKPNDGFLKQLEIYDRLLNNSNTLSYVCVKCDNYLFSSNDVDIYHEYKKGIGMCKMLINDIDNIIILRENALCKYVISY
jgi:protein-tyrosine phosphatase